jgi:MOSC domain-containing protein YiiM
METSVKHVSREALEAGLEQITSPKHEGVLELIVRRPHTGQREVLETAELDSAEGLVGDSWSRRGYARTPADPDTQLTIMSSRVIDLVAQERARWQLAGDQLFVDLDLSEGNLPPGTRLALGSAIVEVSGQPHAGCGKFVERFGIDAMKFVNSPRGRALRLRGLYARVVQRGTIRVGDSVRKLS